MSQDIVTAMGDLYGNVSFKSGNKSSGGGLWGRVRDALTSGRARAVSRGGGYSDGGNWRTALDTNANGRVLDDIALGIGVIGSFAPAGRAINTLSRFATGYGIYDHYR
jgi:hypothetical protein